jgi:hypothetical protein
MKTILVPLVIVALAAMLHAVDTSKPFDLTTMLGEKFKNCHITKVTPDGLTIVHDGGVARISFAILDDEWKQQFNYDPEKAREYAKEQDEKRAAAEASRAEMAKQRKLEEEKRMEELAAAERKRSEDDARALKEYQESLKSAATPATPLAPLPGDATPNLNMIAPQPIMQTEVVVPTLTPVGDPYAPQRIRSQTYVYPDGYHGGYYHGYPYGYYPYQPVYRTYGYPYTPCPSSSIIPGVRGTISSGSFSIRIGR